LFQGRYVKSDEKTTTTPKQHETVNHTLDHISSELGTVKPQKYNYNVHDVNSTGELMNTEQKIYQEMHEIQKQQDNLREEQKKLSEGLKSTSEAQSEYQETKRAFTSCRSTKNNSMRRSKVVLCL